MSKRKHVCTNKDESFDAKADEFILINCYEPHSYGTKTGSECLWCHFDGPLAKNF
ncbi:MAG: hypothetical protein ACLRZ6_01060 [Lachnospiraceae bacterium]